MLKLKHTATAKTPIRRQWMKLFRAIALLFGCLTLLLLISACASIQHSERFDEHPMRYLIGEWEGTVNVPGDKLLSPDRILVIYYQPESQFLKAHYGIPGTRYQGPTSVKVIQFNGNIGISFTTGSQSRATLWLKRLGDDLVLIGELKTTNLPNQMILRKKAF